MSGARFVDRNGNPISLMEYATLTNSPEYVRVLNTHVGRVEVSTVWLGLNHAFGDNPGEYFETRCFDLDERGERIGSRDFERYGTEAAARLGHDAAVSRLREPS